MRRTGLPTRVAAVVVMIAGSVLLAGALAEAMVRLVSPQPQTPLTAGFAPAEFVSFDERYGWKFAPHAQWTWQNETTVHTNALGLRDRDYGPKAANEIRVLSLGDSFAFGAGVELEETYGKVLERKLGERFPACTFTVINAGIPGYGQRQELAAFHDLGGSLAPDLVLASFVAGNDVENNAKFDRQLRERVKTPLGFVGRHSEAARLVLKAAFPVTDAMMNRDTAYIAETIDLLRRLESDVRAAGLPYLMFVIPARHQIRPRAQLWSRLLIRAGLENYLFRQNRMVLDHLESEHVPYVDMLAPLVGHDAVESVVFDDDSHTNAVGHAVMAEALLPRVSELVAGTGRCGAVDRQPR